MTTRRDEYTQKMKTQLDAWNARIDALEQSAHDSKMDMRSAYFSEISKARHQSKLAMQKLDDLRTTGEESWEKMVAEMEKFSDAVRHSFSYFKSQI